MLEHQSTGVTLTMTTCRRLDYFIRTIDQFRVNCLDFDRITRIIVSDDRSSEQDRLLMKAAYPEFEFVWRECGHAKSLQLLFDMVDTKYFFHLEDDRVLLHKMPLISICEEVMSQSGVSSFVCGLSIGRFTGKKKIATAEGHKLPYYIHKYIDDGRFSSDWDTGNTSWPGFYLAPGMHLTKPIQEVRYEPADQHERTFALRYQAAGHKTAFTCGIDLFEHLVEVSAYKHRTQSPR